MRADDATLSRWSQIGEAVTPVGVFFSGIAFIAISLTLLYQGREIRQQRDELTVAVEQQRRSSEIALRALHTDLIKMAIDDRELRRVWPPIAPGVPETKKDHYCNLVLNLQKIAYETHTIELAELRAALTYLFSSRDVCAFWTKARAARASITGGDTAEDFFTSEVDRRLRSRRSGASTGPDSPVPWRRDHVVVATEAISRTMINAIAGQPGCRAAVDSPVAEQLC